MDTARASGRTQIAIDGQTYVLGASRDLVDVMSQIEAAAASPPAFVDLSDGDHLISVLILPTTRVVVSVAHEAGPDSEAMFPVDQVSDWDM